MKNSGQRKSQRHVRENQTENVGKGNGGVSVDNQNEKQGSQGIIIGKCSRKPLQSKDWNDSDHEATGECHQSKIENERSKPKCDWMDSSHKLQLFSLSSPFVSGKNQKTGGKQCKSNWNKNS